MIPKKIEENELEFKERVEFELGTSLHSIRELIENMLYQAVDVNVFDYTTATQALTMALQARKVRNKTEGARKFLLGNTTEYTKVVNRVVGDLKDEIQNIEDMLIKKIDKWKSVVDQDGTTALSKISIDEGSLYEKTSHEFKVVDLECIPKKYFIVNEAAIKEDIENGLIDIPGIEITTKKEIKIRVMAS